MKSVRRSRIFLAFGSSAPMIFALVTLPGAAPQKKPAPTGASYFAKNCAPCHGAKGVGGAGFAKPLTGTRSEAELGKFISSSMPPGGKTPLAQAKLIAEYMHREFYSPLAQERNRPPRIELARLTVRQFKNAVADIVGDYHSVVLGEPGGLRGEYFKGRDIGNQRVIDRTDSQINFSFGPEGPAPGKVEPHNYSVAWTGSLLAPDTGDYELIVQTDYATQLEFNGAPKPLIDAWVKSGPDTEFRGSVSLIGGRAYPIRLEFSKATQGVNDDDKKKKVAPKPAFIRLLWRRPKSVVEPIASQFLFPRSTPPTYVVSTPFPPDDRSIGYERGNTVTKAWDDATTSAALELNDVIASNLAKYTGVQPDSKQRAEKLKEFAKTVVTRAFRRPLTKDVEDFYIERQFKVAPTPEIGVKRAILLALKSPRFLYREIGNRRDPYAIASELSFGLWDSVPDPELLRAAESGGLSTRAGIEQQATRMANDPRAWTKLRDFLLLWLKVDDIPNLVKSKKQFPGFDGLAAADLRTSMDLFLQSTAWSKDASFRELMVSDKQFLNGRLAKLYGASLPEDAPFQPISSPDRVGILTQPYLMSRFAYLEGSSPIHRGVLIARSMLGRTLNPPPAAFTPLEASLHPSLTTRQRVSLQTKPTMCNSCHGLINPLGFPFEKYDAIGRLRSADNGKPVDSSGSYVSRSGSVVKFKDASDLANYIANSDEAHAAFTEKLFQHLTKQPIRAYGPKTLSRLQESFKKGNYNMRSLMISIMMATVPEQANAKSSSAKKP